MLVIRSSFFMLLMMLIAPSQEQADKSLSQLMKVWDQLLPASRFSDIADFSRVIREEDGERVYEFSANAEDNSLLFSVVIAVGPIGSHLNPASWENAVSKASEEEKALNFPEIGSRAQLQAMVFSPRGALSGVAFATSDGRFDVFVSVFEASSAAPRGQLTALETAQRIEQVYDDTFE